MRRLIVGVEVGLGRPFFVENERFGLELVLELLIVEAALLLARLGGELEHDRSDRADRVGTCGDFDDDFHCLGHLLIPLLNAAF